MRSTRSIYFAYKARGTTVTEASNLLRERVKFTK